MGIINRIKGYFFIIFNSKLGRSCLWVIGVITLIGSGIFINAIWNLGDKITSDALLAFFSSLLAVLVSIIFLFERVIRLDLDEKKIQSEEKKLKLYDIELNKKSFDEKTFNQQLCNYVVNILSREVGNVDKIYEERAKHFGFEKEELAQKFLDMLADRIKHLRTSNNINIIRIIFDSGTTIAPMFGYMALNASEDSNYWTKGVQIITNNLRGTLLTLKYRENNCENLSRNPDEERYREIPLQCSLLPGKILTAYEAIADEDTLRALEFLGINKKNIYTISVTTGNYILLHDGKFLPIARAKYHPHVKRALYAISDEIYVVAPLGKILISDDSTDFESMLKKLNEELGYNSDNQHESTTKYLLVNSKSAEFEEMDKKFSIEFDDWSRKSILVTTKRENSDEILYPHYQSIKASLHSFCPNFDLSNKLTKGHLWATEFQDLSGRSRENQFKIEVPHKNLRPYAQKYLGINNVSI